jgi:retron-type reverse transcriptase
LNNIEKLKSTNSLSDLAKLLGYKPKSVSYILYQIPENEKYTAFTIPKSGGGERDILAPVPRLKELQSRLSNLLQKCFQEIYGLEQYKKPLSYGFRKHQFIKRADGSYEKMFFDIIGNAGNHKNKRYVFNIDLKDFFPSINFGRVHGFFIKNKDFALNPQVATVIAQIACYDHVLPQGSPVSPVISNLIGQILDVRLVQLAKKASCAYSRYADDITFSTNQKEFPPIIANQNTEDKWVPSKQLRGIIKRSWFDINEKKISMQYRLHRQMVTGLVVNKKVNIRASYYRQARAMCDSLFRTGEFYIGKEMRGGKAKDSDEKFVGTLKQLRGVVSYVYHVKKQVDKRDIKEKWQSPTAIHKLYRKFLFFEKFHALEKPLIMCEGKTDSVYLRCALKSLSASFPNLVSIDGEDINYLVNFFRQTQRNLDIFQFSGGITDFPPFIGNYEKHLRPFLCDGRNHPVILLIDNDGEAGKVFATAKEKGKIKTNVTGSEKFYHIVENLYLVALPKKSGGSHVVIEDFFEDKVKKEIVAGKTFNPNEKTFDKDKNYGKHVFAEKVIKANQKTVNFDGFKPILDRLSGAIADYARR